MSDALHIDTVALHLDTAGDAVALDRLSRRGLARCGRHVLPPDGMPVDAVVAVQSLRIALDVEGVPTESQLASAFGAAFTEGVAAVLWGVPAGVPTDPQQRVVWFADLHTAELAWVRAQADPSQLDGWWWRHVVESRRRDDPAATVVSWVERAPDRWQTSVWSLLAGRDPTSTLPLEAVRALVPRDVGALSAARLRADVPGQAGRSVEGVASSVGSEARALAETHTADFVWSRAPSEARRVFLALGGPWRELAAFLLTASVLPATQTWSPAQTQALVRAASSSVGPDALRSAAIPGFPPPPSHALATPMDAGGGVNATTATPDGAELEAPSSSRPDSGTPSSENGVVARSSPLHVGVHAVQAGGLLFLIRRLPWSELPENPLALHRHLETLGLSILQRLYAPLPEARRRAALQTDAGLLAVFAGGMPDPELSDRDWAPASDLDVQTLLAGLPDTTPAREGLRAAGLDHASAPLDQALQAVLLRSGRLELGPGHADLHLPLSCVDLALRLGGWDLDPGWVPRLGRVIRFHYGEQG